MWVIPLPQLMDVKVKYRALTYCVLIEVNDEKELREYKVKELKFKPRRRRDNIKLSPEEMKELEALEDKGGKSKINDVK